MSYYNGSLQTIGNNIWTFGGEIGYNEITKMREVSNSLNMWDWNKMDWIALKQYNQPQERRNFASTIVGYKYYCIYGGIAQTG